MTVGLADVDELTGSGSGGAAADERRPGRRLLARLATALDRSFVRFCLVGASNTLLSFGLFTLCIAVLEPRWGRAFAAQAIAYGGGIVWSYAWNSRWTFRYRGAVVPAFSAFAGAQVSLLTLSSLAVGLAVDGLALPATPSWIAVTAGVTLLNYLTLRKLVFRRRPAR